MWIAVQLLINKNIPVAQLVVHGAGFMDSIHKGAQFLNKWGFVSNNF